MNPHHAHRHPFGKLLACALAACGLFSWATCTQAERPGAGPGERAPKMPAKPNFTGPAAEPVWFAEKPPAGAIWLETLDLGRMDQGWGKPQAGRSVDERPLTLHGAVYPHGIGTHASSEWTIDLKGRAQRFAAVIGVDDESGEKGSVVFSVWVDNKEVKRSEVMHGGDLPVVLEADLQGAHRLILVVEGTGDGIDHDHADWAAAMLTLVPGPGQQPVATSPPDEPAPPIAANTPPEPMILAPRITGGTPGRPFLFRIPATGAEPLHFSAKNLPPGLSLDPQTGIISGSLASEGRTHVEIVVKGPNGQAAGTVTIIGGPRALALTPPMGWNSWNVWGTAVDDAKIRAAADWMVKSGLAAHGFQYINIDDAWEAGRDDQGRIQTNEKFPDMKALADYVHSKGLKLGIYSSPGPKTCAGYEGSYQHEQSDANRYAEWGIDLLKYDWCSYGDIAKDDSLEELQKPYKIMREALNGCERDIVFSLCQYGKGDVSKWGKDVGGNYWRTTGDITDTWLSMSDIGFGQSGLEAYAGPGLWNDPDMLVVGKVGWGPTLHDSKLPRNEQITHITLWSLLASPLLIGCDLSQLDEFTLALLTNPEVLEASQDPLGKQARRVTKTDYLEVWARPLADGTMAIGLFNRGRTAAPVTAHWKDLGLTGRLPVRNLWLRRDEGVFEESYTATVPRHGAVLISVGRRGEAPVGRPN
jgi:alpha-galactosidase